MLKKKILVESPEKKIHGILAMYLDMWSLKISPIYHL